MRKVLQIQSRVSSESTPDFQQMGDITSSALLPDTVAVLKQPEFFLNSALVLEKHQ